MKFQYLLLITILSLLIISCEDDDSTPSNIPTNVCSALGIVQNTIYYDSTEYVFVVTGPYNNGFLIEIANSNWDTTSVSVEFLQIQNGTSCYESNNITIYNPGQYGYAFLVSNFPTFQLDSNASAIAKLTFDSTVYFVRDSSIN